MIKQRGFTVVEFILIIVAIAVLAGVGYFVYQKKFNNSPTSARKLQELQDKDPYFREPPYYSASDEQREASANASSSLQASAEGQVCGEHAYQVLDDSGNIVGCVHGGE